jgi:glycosyltransferase involved in cell wall biosynthesis
MTEAINLLIEDRKLAERLGEKARELGPSITASSIAEQWRQYMKKIVADRRNR